MLRVGAFRSTEQPQHRRGQGTLNPKPLNPKTLKSNTPKPGRSETPRYSTMLQQAEVIDSRELGQQAMAELQMPSLHLTF